MLWLLNLLLMAVAVMANSDYQIAVKSADSDDIVLFGSVVRQKDAMFSVNPNVADLSEIPESGCVGVLEKQQFTCQSLYKLGKLRNRGAIRALVGPRGDLFQFQLAEGKIGDLIIDSADIVTDHVAAPINKNTKSSQVATEIDEEEESEPGFFKKYWMYIVPGLLVLATNMLKPDPKE